MKALDALNQELFQLWMADKETVSDRGVHLSRQLQILAASFPDHFPPDHGVEMKRDHFYGGLPKMTESDGTLPEGRTTGQSMYSDYLRATRGLKKKIP